MSNRKQTKGEPFEHWQPCVEVWFQFCRDNFQGEEPSFDGSSPKDLKAILTQLRKRAELKKVGWIKENAIQRLRLFLQMAFQDKWLKEHWTLSNINRSKDAIFFNAKAGVANKVVLDKKAITELPKDNIYDFVKQ